MIRQIVIFVFPREQNCTITFSQEKIVNDETIRILHIAISIFFIIKKNDNTYPFLGNKFIISKENVNTPIFLKKKKNNIPKTNSLY